jgi:hypothetical protein
VGGGTTEALDVDAEAAGFRSRDKNQDRRPAPIHVGWIAAGFAQIGSADAIAASSVRVSAGATNTSALASGGVGLSTFRPAAGLTNAVGVVLGFA